jgi:DNA (cytosine-5)-methyltransferase 1
MTFGSLFAGIGGMDLGLERAGMECKWQVEIDPYARRVLARHWPGVRRWDDVRTFPPDDGTDWTVDLIAGGFPCQDISSAGNKVGIDGEQSGLWREYARIIGRLRPRLILVENVAALSIRGIDRVLGDLASLGFDAEWDVIPAAALGAPHIRERMFIVAYADSEHGRTWRTRRPFGVAEGLRLQVRSIRDGQASFAGAGDWSTEPDVVRLVHGLPVDVVRRSIRGLGNAVVPQVAEWIGRRIMEHANGPGA